MKKYKFRILIKKIKIYGFLCMLILFCFWYFYLRTAKYDKLIKQGNILIEKVERYKTINNKIPNSLKEIGENEESDNYPFFYQKHDSLYYSISFGISIDDSKIYYSDTKQWEDIDRNIGKQ